MKYLTVRSSIKSAFNRHALLLIFSGLFLTLTIEAQAQTTTNHDTAPPASTLRLKKKTPIKVEEKFEPSVYGDILTVGSFGKDPKGNELRTEFGIGYRFTSWFDISTNGAYTGVLHPETSEASDFDDIEFSATFSVPKIDKNDSIHLNASLIGVLPSSKAAVNDSFLGGYGIELYSDIDVRWLAVRLYTKGYSYYYEYDQPEKSLASKSLASEDSESGSAGSESDDESPDGGYNYAYFLENNFDFVIRPFGKWVFGNYLMYDVGYPIVGENDTSLTYKSRIGYKFSRMIYAFSGVATKKDLRTDDRLFEEKATFGQIGISFKF